MRYWLGLAIIAAMALLIAATKAPAEGNVSPAADPTCTGERWSVKTLSDADAWLVNFTPQDSTVHELAALTASQTLPPDNRVAPTELTTYRLQAYLREMKLEADGDIAIVLIDPDVYATMRIEFPDPTCAGAAQSPYNAQMAAARQGFVNLYGEPSSAHTTLIEGFVTMTGVGFFDPTHGKRGAAPNGIELHPVLSFDWPFSITPSPFPTPTPTVSPIPDPLFCDVVPPVTAAPGCIAGTPTPTPTPLRSPLTQMLYWGDLDCSGQVTAYDAIVNVFFTGVIGRPEIARPCPFLGEGVTVGGHPRAWGGVGCGGSGSILDPVLDLLLYVAGLDYPRTADCPDAGDLVEVVSHPFTPTPTAQP